MNINETIFKPLNVEPNEIFMLHPHNINFNDKNLFYIDTQGYLMEGNYLHSGWQLANISTLELLRGRAKIIKGDFSAEIVQCLGVKPMERFYVVDSHQEPVGDNDVMYYIDEHFGVMEIRDKKFKRSTLDIRKLTTGQYHIIVPKQSIEHFFAGDFIIHDNHPCVIQNVNIDDYTEHVVSVVIKDLFTKNVILIPAKTIVENFWTSEYYRNLKFDLQLAIDYDYYNDPVDGYYEVNMHYHDIVNDLLNKGWIKNI